MTTRWQCFVRLGFIGGLVLVLSPLAHAQRRPYLGYAFPAGGQAGTTLQIRLGGQDLDTCTAVTVTGEGVTARVVEYYRRLGNQETQLLNEQLKELKKAAPPAPATMAPATMAPATMAPATMAPATMAPATMAENPAMMGMADSKDAGGNNPAAAAQDLIAEIELRIRESVPNPACASIASLVAVEVVIAPNARPGLRELRLVTAHGISNPLVFHVGQVHEYARKAMISATLQVLGKEASALRKRPPGEAEVAVELPCTVNGQIASGEVNRYRFKATKGQRLVFSTLARQLIPYIADAVPGWFQPVLVVTDAQGRELAYADDYRFEPDPVILFQVPQDGEYTFAIHDSIYRGREDFVYRITVSERPFLTSLFPLGGTLGAAETPAMAGWNLQNAMLEALPAAAGPGLQPRVASRGGQVSNTLLFALDPLPGAFDHEPNNTVASAQRLALPGIVNGRIAQAGDWDIYQFTGVAKQPIVAEVSARRLKSPLDSILKLTDTTGKVLACNDDCEDLAAGVNTHHADSYLAATLPADGAYFIHIGDTACHGGGEYGYRLRISAPQPDFELRVVPSSVSVPINASATASVYVVRKDGFTGPIRLELSDPPAGFSAAPVTLADGQAMTRITVKGGAVPTTAPVRLTIVGRAKVGDREWVHHAVPAEDRMQAFLWRHLVPATELLAMIHDPKYQPPPKRVAPVRPPPVVATRLSREAAATAAAMLPLVGPPAPTTELPFVGPPAPAKPQKFTKQQIVGRLKQIKGLYEERLLTDTFYDAKVSECELAQ